MLCLSLRLKLNNNSILCWVRKCLICDSMHLPQNAEKLLSKCEISFVTLLPKTGFILLLNTRWSSNCYLYRIKNTKIRCLLSTLSFRENIDILECQKIVK